MQWKNNDEVILRQCLYLNCNPVENTDSSILKKKPQLGKHLPVHIPPPSPHCPSTWKGHGMCERGRGRLCSQSCPCHRALGTRGQSRSSSLLGSLVRAEHLPWEAPQQPPSVTDFLWPLAFGTSPPRPREEAAQGGPASIPPFSPAHSCLFIKAPKSRTHQASPRSQPCQAGKERSQLLAPPMLSKLPLPRAGRCCLPGCSSFIRSRWGARRA